MSKDMQEVVYRQARPGDLQSLQTLHHEMFPVDYEEKFFERVVNCQDGLENLTAYARDGDGNEAVIGFVTARIFRLWECDPLDRAYLELEDRLLDHESIFYILTLAVSPNFRKRGIGSRLVEWVVLHAQECSCRAAYLHVIDYNTAAISLYSAQGFQEIACRENFYQITSGRQPDPKKQIYNAYLFAFLIDNSVDRGLMSYLFLAITPFRMLMGHLQSCLPWNSPPDSYFGGGEVLPLDNVRHTAGKGSPGAGRALGRQQIPPWLLSLFSRQKLLRQH